MKLWQGTAGAGMWTLAQTPAIGAQYRESCEATDADPKKEYPDRGESGVRPADKTRPPDYWAGNG